MSFLTFVGGMAKKVNEIKAEERAFEKDLMLQTAKIKTEAEYDPDEMLDHTVSWNYTDAKGKSQKANISFRAGDPLNASLFKDENDRIDSGTIGLKQLNALPPEAVKALIAGQDPNNANHGAYNKIAPVFDYIGNKYSNINTNQSGATIGTSSLGMGFDDSVYNHFLAPIDQSIIGLNVINSRDDIINNSNIDFNNLEADEQESINMFADGLFGVINEGGSVIPSNDVQNNLTTALGNPVLLEDKGLTFNLISEGLKGSLVQRQGQSQQYLIAPLSKKEINFLPQVKAMTDANFNSTNITYEIGKAFMGYTGKDAEGNDVVYEGLANYQSGGGFTFNVKTRIEGMLDTASDIGKILNPKFQSMRNLSAQEERRVARFDEQGREISRAFYTGAKDLSTGDGTKLIKDKLYDGMTISRAMNIDVTNKDVGLMERIQALQIHLAFQVAIASQGYEGGKAVSDADFDRAWSLVGGGEKGLFRSMVSKEEVEAKLKTLLGILGSNMAYNQAFEGMADGVKFKGATIYRNTTYDYWSKNIAPVVSQDGASEPNDYGYWFLSTIGQPSPVEINWESKKDKIRFDTGFTEGDFARRRM